MWHVMAMDLRPLDAYLPPDTRPLLERWLNDSTCRLVVKGPRKTKRGDFRPGQRGQVPTLTINVDLKPLQFLLTLTHEIAHLLVWQNCGHLRQPHGPHWKHQFGQLLLELSEIEALPVDYRRALVGHAARPKACAERDPELMKVIRRLEGDDSLWLDDIEIGEVFGLEGRRFQKLQSNRTRCLCLDLDNGLKYRVSKSVAVHRAH